MIGWGPDYRLEPLDPMALDPTYFGTAAGHRANPRLVRAREPHQGRAAARDRRVRREAQDDLVVVPQAHRAEHGLHLEGRRAGKLVAPTTSWKSDDDHGFPSEDELRWKKGNILQPETGAQVQPVLHRTRGGASSAAGTTIATTTCARSIRRPAQRCSRSSRPDNPRALALLMGIPEKKLPWPLQHWTTREPYTGNSILDRIDPQDSRLDDPWRHLDLRLSIALSKRAYNRLRKEHGLG